MIMRRASIGEALPNKTLKLTAPAQPMRRRSSARCHGRNPAVTRLLSRNHRFQLINQVALPVRLDCGCKYFSRRHLVEISLDRSRLVCPSYSGQDNSETPI